MAPVTLARDNGAKLLWNLLMNLRQAQERITNVRDRWEALDPSLFGDFQAKYVFEQIAIEEGLFFGLCQNASGVGEELTARCLTNPRFKEFKNSGEILTVWSGPFLQPRREVQHSVQWSLFDDERQENA